jgi:seryl-tRNA synthetase
MTTTKSELDRAWQELQRQRDELNLKMHLAKAEAKDEWQELEKKWHEVKPKLDAAGGEAAKAGENVLAGLKLTLEEMRKGYERIKSRLS